MKHLSLIMAALLVAFMWSCAPQHEGKATISGLQPEAFQSTVDGKATHLFVLTNDNGMEACITNFGGRVVSLMVPDRDGNMCDVVLGFDSISSYVNVEGNNFGALIGRYGNRIENGQFTLDGKQYSLPQNNFGHSLHGGPNGYYTKMWEAEQIDEHTLKLTLHSPDGDAGYPGNLDVTVTYTLTPDNALDITYEAVTDAPTVVNLTNHSYFNLGADHQKDILDHEVMIAADSITPIDSTFMTHGTMMAVEGTPFDFRTPKAVGRDINADNPQLRNGRGYDHNFVLSTQGDISKVSASIYSPATGILMEVLTDEPGLQFYVGNFLDGTVKGKHGVAYPYRGAICMETQHYPNSPNQPAYPSTVLRPGQQYTSHCIYRFITR
ncbi:MAG: galactose mutarotase [Muribaculaceae bacterium]|nr:galactose mutarotase [Muribaculaceae bacterium]